MSHRLTALLVPALLAGLLLGSAPAATAAEGDDVTWGVRTADGDLGTNRENFNYSVEPGGSVSDALIVTNYDDVALTLDVSAADGFTNDDGTLDVLPRGTESESLGVWLSPDTATVVIEPGASATVPFTVEVPAGATPGDYAGAVLTSLLSTADSGVQVDRRIGIRVHLRVGGELAPALVVDDLALSYSGTPLPFASGDATVTFVVRNTGNTRLAAGQVVELAGPFGWFARTPDAVEPIPELLPGESWPVSIAVAGVVPAFLLTADVELSPRLPDGVDPVPVSPVRVSVATAAVPWALLALVVLIAGAVVALVLVRRRAAARATARVDAAVAEALRERELV